MTCGASGAAEGSAAAAAFLPAAGSLCAGPEHPAIATTPSSARAGIKRPPGQRENPILGPAGESISSDRIFKWRRNLIPYRACDHKAQIVIIFDPNPAESHRKPASGRIPWPELSGPAPDDKLSPKEELNETGNSS
jgi:hypothetical protein